MDGTFPADVAPETRGPRHGEVETQNLQSTSSDASMGTANVNIHNPGRPRSELEETRSEARKSPDSGSADPGSCGLPGCLFEGVHVDDRSHVTGEFCAKVMCARPFSDVDLWSSR